MTRPSIVRADTLDLQDPDSPHAAEHNKLTSNGIAPHQALQYQHIEKERQSEEQNLVDAWAMSGSAVEPENSQRTAEEDHNEQDTIEEGVNGAEAEDGDQEADDDLMDRISSSPSIDDGKHSTSTNTSLTALSNNPLPPLQRSSRIALWRNADGTHEWIPYDAMRSRRVDLPSTVSASMLSNLPSTATQSNDFFSQREREGRYRPDTTNEELWQGPITTNAFRTKTNQSPRLYLQPNAFRTKATQSTRLYLQPDCHTDDTLNLRLEDVLLPQYDPLLSPSDTISSTSSDFDCENDDDDSKDDPFDDENYSLNAALPLSRRDSDYMSYDTCLQLIEDIDFEFVYALHTFVATVEGQANATKGDTMVLLDDTNSYWWLVRIVKDSSIGYLPAEHIETPTERLARLNKHRNIDLSQTMLGDNPEKSRNPLKMAMRRRNAKTVQFTAPTYVEASDYEYSEDEENIGDESLIDAPVEDAAVNGQPIEVEERNAPEEANVHATRRHSGDQASIASKNSFDSTHKASLDGGIGEDPQLSPKLVDRSEAAPLKSRKGTPRNTDSFLKDDSIETRKITLTPGLLREDNNTANNISSKSSSMDSQRNPSMESLTKVTSPADSTTSSLSKKDSNKKKEKNKGGMLSGLFKSKKKDKKAGKDDDSEERASFDVTRGTSPQHNGSASPVERSSNVVATAAAAGREIQVQSRPEKSATSEPMVAELQGSEAAYEMVGTVPEVSTTDSESHSILKQTPKTKKAKQRVGLDDFDSPDEQHNPFSDSAEHDAAATMSPSGTITDGADFVHIPTSFNDDEVEEIKPRDSQGTATEDDSELYADARENTISPTGRESARDTISGRESQARNINSAGRESQTAPLQVPARGGSTSSHSSSGAEAETPKSASVVSHDGKQAWDDGALRAWLDAEEVKDMLTIVHSSSLANGTVEPVSDDHPLMRGLYTEERGAVDRMMTELDTLLMGFASRKGLA